MALACERAEVRTEQSVYSITGIRILCVDDRLAISDPFDYKSFGDLHAQQFRNLFDFNTHIPRVATIQALLLMSFREVSLAGSCNGKKREVCSVDSCTSVRLCIGSERCRITWLELSWLGHTLCYYTLAAPQEQEQPT